MKKSAFIKELRTLVSFRTLTGDKGENEKALDFIESKLHKRAFVQRIENKGVECLIASSVKTKSPDVCFLVHADVVAAKLGQFKLALRDGKAYGRGTSDMKFSIPMGYSLLNEVIDLGLRTSFSLVVTTDEETGGFAGAGFLAGAYGLKPKLLIVPDGGDDFVFINRSKGVCGIRVDASGVPAHSSRVWMGKSAIEPLVALCSKVMERYRKNNGKESWNTTVNIGKFQGGVSSNQVCPKAFVTLDFRFPETSSQREILNEVKAMAKKIDPNLSVSIFSEGEPTFVDTKNPKVHSFLRCFEKAIGRRIRIRGAYGASDARHFAKLGIPTLMIKPNGGDIHGDNEFIDVDSCMLFYEALRSFIKITDQCVN